MSTKSTGSKRARIAVTSQTQEFERAAAQIEARLREAHMPYGTLMDPIFASPESDQIVSYTRSGDSAIWSGHYLAAQAFRYASSKEDGAVENANAVLDGITALIDATGSDILSRVVVPAASPYAAAIQKEEGGHGVFTSTVNGMPVFWIGNTTRDQYSGVLFGLGAAWELIPALQSRVTALIERLVGYLVDHSWVVRMPDGRISTVFLQRPDQQLAFVQIARKASPKRFNSAYKLLRLTLSGVTVVPIAYEVLDDHHSYFKFNLDTVNLYSLIHFEEDKSIFRKNYRKAYDVLRRTTDDHQNAHFNMLDRALKGPNSLRDEQTIDYLSRWLRRPRRDPFVDLRDRFKACGEDRACQVIPVEMRPTTDFLWQRSPFLSYGGGAGLVEGAGIDFLLPYWMARYYNLVGGSEPNAGPTGVS